MLEELPAGCGMRMTPSADKPEYFRILLSNQSLLELSLHQNITIWQQTMQQSSSIIEAQVKLSTDLFIYITGCRFWLTGLGTSIQE
jgi:hypothetical protein